MLSLIGDVFNFKNIFVFYSLHIKNEDMETFLPITYLNDFVFCPYSIYLHQVFDCNEDIVYTALPQQKGKFSHKHVDVGDSVCKQQIVKGVYVISNRLGVYGKIDTYYPKRFKLIESKYLVRKLYKGFLYQLWAQFFAMEEMGYTVKEVSLFSIKDKQSYKLKLPGVNEYKELRGHIKKIARFDFEQEMKTNISKCKHCIYAALCDKTNSEHVYT